MKVGIADILKAQKTIQPVIKNTPLRQSAQYSAAVGYDVFLKLENMQRTGSFKIRGAANKLASLSKEEKKNGVIAASAGNHAQGVACVAALNGVRAVIVMPAKSPLIKVLSTRRFGAEVILHGENYDEAYAHALTLQKKENLTFIHPYQDELVIAGQGTIGLEIHEEMPDLDIAFIPVGGGGLLAGIGTALKNFNPRVKIIGVQAEGAASMAESFQKGKLVTGVSVSTIADGIAVKKPSEIMFKEFISKLCDDVLTVSDEEIAQAIVLLMERSKTTAEGAGAAALAACLNNKAKGKFKKAVAVVSGGNIDLNLLARVIDRGLQVSGRLARIVVATPDIPGVMQKLTSVIAEKGANIIDITHSHVSDRIRLRETLIEFTLETTGPDQVEALKDGFTALGYRILN